MVWDGRYRIERTLGEGGMGEVFLARDLAKASKPVALKVLRAEYRDVTPSFMQEYLLQRRFRHPAIPRVYDFGYSRRAAGEVPYFVMEYVPGTPLNRIIDPTADQDGLWAWVFEVLRALDHLHRRGFVHRDLKPGNILIDPSRRGAVHLIDFGICARAGAEPEEFFIGTPEYCAPELMVDASYDGRADLYALGLILYELFEGRAPWPGSEPEELYRARMMSRPPDMRSPRCPTAVQALIQDLLRPFEADRPASAAIVLERLASALGRREPIERGEAFALGLEGIPVRTPLYDELLTSEHRLTLIDVPAGADASQLLCDVADARAVHGVRVVRLDLTQPKTTPLASLQPALDIFGRLRLELGGAPTLPGMAGAATMLSRLHHPTLFVVDGLELADHASLAVLRQVFVGQANPQLRLIATVHSRPGVAQPPLVRALAALPICHRHRLDPASKSVSDAWLVEAIDGAAADGDVADTLYRGSGGDVGVAARHLAEAFRSRALIRTAAGYSWQGTLAPIEVRCVLPADPAFAEVATVPIPTSVAVAAFGADQLRSLIDEGWLVETPSAWVAAAPRQRAADPVDAARRHAAAGRLVAALEAAEPFPGHLHALAEACRRTSRPASAVPHLVAAMRRDVSAYDRAQALAHLDEAATLLNTDRASDAEGTGWQRLLARTEVRVARRHDDIDRLESAATTLLTLASDDAHITTLVEATEGLVEVAAWRGDWPALRRRLGELDSLAHCGRFDGAQLTRTWAAARLAAATGPLTQALETIRGGRAPQTADVPGRRWLRVLALEVDLLVRLSRFKEARVAARGLKRAATLSGDRSAIAEAGIYEVACLRATGWPSKALTKIGEISQDLGVVDGGRLDARIALTMARCRADFGHHVTALEHARRAQRSATSCGAYALAFAARVVEARAITALGRPDAALDILTDALWQPHPTVGPGCRHEASCVLLEARRAADPHDGQLLTDAISAARIARDGGHEGWARQLSCLALQIALDTGRDADAVQLASRLKVRADEIGDNHAAAYVLGHLRALAHARMGWTSSAQTLAASASVALRAAADRIADPDLRSSWLRKPIHVAILAGIRTAAARASHARPATEEFSRPV